MTNTLYFWHCRPMGMISEIKYKNFFYLLHSYDTDPEVAGAGEVLSILVEGDSHDSVCRVEGLLNTVAMVNVNVDV